MSIRTTWILALPALLCCMRAAAATVVPPAAAADSESIRQTFVAAMQRVRQHLPDVPDSAGLEAYILHDYVVAARLRRDLNGKADEALDAAIDAFLQTHQGQPVTHGLRHDWLLSLADRRRWERYLARSTDVTDPVLICDRLEARLALGNTQGLGVAALERWSLPQEQPAECDDVFAWLRLQNLLTPALAEARTRAALAVDNPRLARTFAADVPVARSAALLQWSDLLEAPKSALTVLATHPALPVEPDALAAGFEKLTRGNSADALDLLPLLLARSNVTPALKNRLLRAAALGAAYDHDPRAPATFDSVPPDTGHSA
jgi:soluble lytic murein transglycosylase